MSARVVHHIDFSVHAMKADAPLPYTIAEADKVTCPTCLQALANRVEESLLGRWEMPILVFGTRSAFTHFLRKTDPDLRPRIHHVTTTAGALGYKEVLQVTLHGADHRLLREVQNRLGPHCHGVDPSGFYAE